MPDNRYGRGRRHRSRLAAGALTIALATTGCSAVSSLAARQAPGGTAGSAAANGASGTSLAAPGSAVPPNPAGPPKDPFAGTPADHWADGTAGIVTPKAEPIGGYTKAQVADAYQTTKKLLVAAYLDKHTLLGGPPAAFEDLLIAPQRTWFVRNLNKIGLDKDGSSLSSREMVMAFAPGDARLIGDVIKVRGTMSAKTAVRQGQEELDVQVDYLFAYAVEPPGRPAQWMRVVPEAVWTVEFGSWQGTSATFAPWVQATGGGVSGAQCSSKDGYQHPAYQVPAITVPNPSGSPSGKPINPYALNGARNGQACQATTGT